MSTRTISTTLDRNVIAVDTAESIGSVTAFVVSPTVDRINKVQIGGRRKHALFADWTDIGSFGDDAVMVTRADAPSESDDDRDIDTAKGALDIIGARILDTAGFEHGVVSDVTFDDSTGDIVSLTNGSDDFASEAVHSLGTYAVVVAR